MALSAQQADRQSGLVEQDARLAGLCGPSRLEQRETARRTILEEMNGGEEATHRLAQALERLFIATRQAPVGRSTPAFASLVKNDAVVALCESLLTAPFTTDMRDHQHATGSSDLGDAAGRCNVHVRQSQAHAVEEAIKLLQRFQAAFPQYGHWTRRAIEALGELGARTAVFWKYAGITVLTAEGRAELDEEAERDLFDKLSAFGALEWELFTLRIDLPIDEALAVRYDPSIAFAERAIIQLLGLAGLNLAVGGPRADLVIDPALYELRERIRSTLPALLAELRPFE